MDVCSKTMNSDRNGTMQELIKATGDAVRSRERHTHGKTASGHIKILRDHGKDISASQTMVDFYAELAEPDTIRGVVVILELHLRIGRYATSFLIRKWSTSSNHG